MDERSGIASVTESLFFVLCRLYLQKFSLTELVKRHDASPLIKLISIMNGSQDEKCVYRKVLVGLKWVCESRILKPGSHLCNKHNTSKISISISTRKKKHVPFFLVLMLMLISLVLCLSLNCEPGLRVERLGPLNTSVSRKTAHSDDISQVKLIVGWNEFAKLTKMETSSIGILHKEKINLFQTKGFSGLATSSRSSMSGAVKTTEKATAPFYFP